MFFDVQSSFNNIESGDNFDYDFDSSETYDTKKRSPPSGGGVGIGIGSFDRVDRLNQPNSENSFQHDDPVRGSSSSSSSYNNNNGITTSVFKPQHSSNGDNYQLNVNNDGSTNNNQRPATTIDTSKSLGNDVKTSNLMTRNAQTRVSAYFGFFNSFVLYFPLAHPQTHTLTLKYVVFNFYVLCSSLVCSHLLVSLRSVGCLSFISYFSCENVMAMMFSEHTVHQIVGRKWQNSDCMLNVNYDLWLMIACDGVSVRTAFLGMLKKYCRRDLCGAAVYTWIHIIFKSGMYNGAHIHLYVLVAIVTHHTDHENRNSSTHTHTHEISSTHRYSVFFFLLRSLVRMCSHFI